MTVYVAGAGTPIKGVPIQRVGKRPTVPELIRARDEIFRYVVHGKATGVGDPDPSLRLLCVWLNAIIRSES